MGRDPRDAILSLWNHHRHTAARAFAFFTDRDDRVGPPLPACPDDIRALWATWINRERVAWESEGDPFWSYLRHVETWWDFRHLANVLFVHFGDLVFDLPGQLRRVADHVGVPATDRTVRDIADAVSFAAVKRNAETLLPQASKAWVGGARTFISKGTNGRWRGILTDDDLRMSDDAARRELTPACRTWLEHGADART